MNRAASFEVELQGPCLTVRVKGTVRREDVVKVIHEHYRRPDFTLALWDFVEADMSELVIEDLKAIADAARESLAPGVHLRVAHVCNEKTLYALGCVYTAIATMADNPAVYSVFSSEADARAWLQKDETIAPFTQALRVRGG